MAARELALSLGAQLPGFRYDTEKEGWSYIWTGFYWVYYEPPTETIVVTAKRAVIKPLDAPGRSAGPVQFAGSESDLAKTTDVRGRPVIPPPDMNEGRVRAMGLNPALIHFDYFDQSTANILFGSHYNVYYGDYYIGRIEVRGKHSVAEYAEDGEQPGQDDIEYVAPHYLGATGEKVDELKGQFPIGDDELLNEFVYQAFNAPVSPVSVSQVEGDQGLAEQFDPLDMGGGSGSTGLGGGGNRGGGGGGRGKGPRVGFGGDGKPPFVLQTGGHTINQSTAKHFGKHKREVGRALENLKSDLRHKPNDHFHKIWSNGDVTHSSTGQYFGNLYDYGL